MEKIRNPLAGVVYQSDELAARYLASGAWIGSTVGDALRATALRYPDRPAYISDEGSLSFSELDERTDRLGGALLELGLAPGDRALFQLGTTLETVIAAVACFKAGIIPVCTIPQYREVEIGSLGRTSRAKAHFVQADFGRFDLVEFAMGMVQQNPTVEHVIVVRGAAPEGTHSLAALMESMPLQEARKRLEDVPVGPRDVLTFQLSGGSTGLPKIIPRFHAEYLGHIQGLLKCHDITAESRVIWSLPLMHNAGQLYALIPPLLMGHAAVLMASVDIRRMLELIEQHGVTHSLSIGPIAPQLIAYPDVAHHDLSSLKLFVAMSRSDSLEQHMGVPCSNLYGITEGLVMSSGATEREFVRHHTQGRSSWADDEVQIRDPETGALVQPGTIGELCFRGASTLLAYFGDEKATQAAFTPDGFFRTGDMFTEHRTGDESHYAFEGRLRDNINRGGEKIGCEEVEGFISQHPSVADAKLVAMPDPFYGERACAYLIVRPGAVAPDVQNLGRFLIDQGLAKFKCPERVEIVDEFPVTRVGKVDKVELRRQIAAQLQAEQQKTINNV